MITTEKSWFNKKRKNFLHLCMPVKKSKNANKFSIIIDADYCYYRIIFNIIEGLTIQGFI